MEAENWESSSGGELSENDFCLEEEFYATAGSLPKLQFRKKASKARWSDEPGMAEVIEKKGQIWVSSGIVRAGKTYCFLEEALYLAEMGALILLDDKNSCMSLEDIYWKVAEGKGGCYMEFCMVYKHMKFLGYILRRHNVPWTLKNMKNGRESDYSNEIFKSGGVAYKESEGENSIVERFNGLQINEVRPMFDIYLPNSKFRKSAPGDPDFVLCSTGTSPPNKTEIEFLESRCGNIPLKFCLVEPGRVSFFSFDKVELPVLP